jgi:hypothetical protein
MWREMNLFRMKCIYTWKCHNGIPYIDILIKQKCPFFSKNEGQEGKTGPVWGLV